jgi:hypothetical protein
MMAIVIVLVGAVIVWALLTNSAEIANWTEEEWIENYEGDIDDPMWH